MHLAARIIALGVALVLSGCASSPRCAFTYDDHVKNDIVLPAIEKLEGKYTANFDTASPVIVPEGSHITLLFNVRSNAIDPPIVIVEIDPCTLRVLDVAESDGTVTPSR